MTHAWRFGGGRAAGVLLALACSVTALAREPARIVHSLDGAWLFQTNHAPENAWKSVIVPSDFQSHEGNGFHGVGWYRRSLSPLAVPTGRRVLIHFQAAATEAEVWWDDTHVGSHLGGWTPFRCDVTELASGQPASERVELRIRLDEKPGHNTQGFLPVVQPHFGGLWQGVQCLVVPETYFDDLQLLAFGNPATGRIEIRVPLRGSQAGTASQIIVRHRLRGQARWTPHELHTGTPTNPAAGGGELRREGDVLCAAIPVEQPVWWSPTQPAWYELELELPAAGSGVPGDRVSARAAFRSVKVSGDSLLLNGQPLNVRGLLNWGYYPPRLSPDPGEKVFRADLEFARSRGFNLMKCCLWVPPPRFLELADEMGMLVWMEYPTWHPKFTPEHAGPLRREFREFFAADRDHPSVILRSLTCETGPGADLAVIQSLYDEAHRMIPGAVVEDDSSWIEWNRVSDFFDDHPYGNNDTWVTTLDRLREFARTNGPKPLLLGEAIAADTWVPRAPYVRQAASLPRPYWFPGALDAQEQWAVQMERIVGRGAVSALEQDSLRYACLMRKFQAEVFRREVPHGGYVISVIRDIATASMGLLDYRGQPKGSERDWAWQGDTACLLKTPGDCRSFAAGSPLRGELLVSHFGGTRLTNSVMSLKIRANDRRGAVRYEREFPGVQVEQGALRSAGSFDWTVPSLDAPQAVVVTCQLRANGRTFANEWPLWLVPAAAALPAVTMHPSVTGAFAAELLSSLPPHSGSESNRIILARRFDDDLLQQLENGARVLMLPDGERGSFPLRPHWFLRGAPCVPEHPLGGRVPRELLVELQSFDLASPVMPELPCLEEVEPTLLLWDTHDLRAVKTHALVFQTRVGRGRLLVSALNHSRAGNAAGQWLLGEFLRDLASGPAPKAALSERRIAAIKAKLHAEKLPLTERTWKFQPEAAVTPAALAWAAVAFDDSKWSDIKVGRHWESQGWPALDGWAWYRLKVQVPAEWAGRRVFLTFEGVDDLYELFINGNLFARRGDLQKRQDTFNEKFSHDLTPAARPGEELTLAVRVHDWYGGGGIFRPVTLGTEPWQEEAELIR